MATSDLCTELSKAALKLDAEGERTACQVRSPPRPQESPPPAAPRAWLGSVTSAVRAAVRGLSTTSGGFPLG